MTFVVLQLALVAFLIPALGEPGQPSPCSWRSQAAMGRSTPPREPFQSLTPEKSHHFACLMVPWKIPLPVLSVAEQAQSRPTVKVVFPEEKFVENNCSKEFWGDFFKLKYI